MKGVLKSSLLQGWVIYTASGGINSAVPLIVIPVLTRYLTPADYGVVSMLGVMVAIVTPLIGVNIHGAIAVKYYQQTRPDLARYIGNCLLVLAASTVAVSLAMLVFAAPISAYTALPAPWLAAVVVIALSQFVSQVVLTLWQMQERPWLFALFQTVQTLVNIALTVFLVVGLGMNWQGRIHAQVLAGLGGGLVAAVVLAKGWVRFDLDREAIVHALRFGVPLIPHALGSAVIAQMGRVFITNMSSVADTGIYMVGFQAAMLIELLAASFNKAFAPWLYRRLSSGDEAGKRQIVKLTYFCFVAILAFAAIFSLAAPPLLSVLVGERFVPAGRFIPWLAFGFAFSGLYYMVTNYIFYAGATHLLAWVTFISALMSLLFNYLLIKANGPIGAAQAMMVTMLISFVLTWVASARAYRMPWNLLRGAEA